MCLNQVHHTNTPNIELRYSDTVIQLKYMCVVHSSDVLCGLNILLTVLWKSYEKNVFGRLIWFGLEFLDVSSNSLSCWQVLAILYSKDGSYGRVL